MSKMPPEIVTDAQLFEALEWLEQNGRNAAQAKATRVYLDGFESHLLAKIAQECMDGPEGLSAAAANIKAKASDAYRIHLEGQRKATEEDAYYTWHRTRLEGLLAAYQTLSANRRAIEKAL